MTHARKLCCTPTIPFGALRMSNWEFLCVHFQSQLNYLWSISLPGKNGTPNSNLCQDKEAQMANTSQFILVPLAHERVITKVFNHYAIPLEISDTIQAAFKLQWM